MSDPNFPDWAQNVILGILGTAGLVVVGFCVLVIFGIISWINSGSH